MSPQSKHEAPPAMQLMQLVTAKWVGQAVYVAAKLGVADFLKGGPKSAEELAKTLKVHGPSLYRVMRALAGLGVLKETKEQTFELTPVGSSLQTGIPGSVRSFAIMMGEDWHWRPWGEILHSVKTGNPAFHHTNKNHPFQFFEKNAEAGQIFNDAMTSFSMMESEAVAKAYDFAGVTRLVDVAGGHGLLLSTVLKAHPKMSGVLFDLPFVIEGAKKAVEAAGLTRRCELARGDFFKAVPGGGDAYMMKHILHDWNDDDAATILKHCRKALGKKGKILVVEMVVPPGSEMHLGKLLDLEMLVMTPGGRERSEADFRSLYERAGFKLTRIVPTPSPVCVIEGVPA